MWQYGTIMKINEKDNRFKIKTSSIPNAGKGLFANKDLKANDYLFIHGATIKVGSIEDDCTEYANNYKFTLPNCKEYIVPIGYAALINHSENPNCVLETIGKERLILRFNRNINKDEELFFNYGNVTIGKFKMHDSNKAIVIMEKDKINLTPKQVCFCPNTANVAVMKLGKENPDKYYYWNLVETERI